MALYGRLRSKERTKACARLLYLPKLRKPDDLFNRPGCERQAGLRLCEVPSPVRRRNARTSLSGTTSAGLSYPVPSGQYRRRWVAVFYGFGLLLKTGDEERLPRQAWRERDKRRQYNVRQGLIESAAK